MTTPLLVDCLDITNWLQKRKKLHKDWYQYLKAAQEKIKVLTKDHQQYTNYNDLKQYIIINQDTFNFVDVNNFVQKLLRTSLAQDKSLVFGYSDKRVKQWTNLQKYMKNKLVGLLSTAKFIKQTLSFDLPGLDKNIQMLDNQLNNLKRKIDYNTNTIFQQNRDREKQQKTLGIDGNQIENQIPKLIKELPNMFEKLHNLMLQNNIKILIQKYNKVCIENGSQNPQNSLYQLKKFIEEGDLTIQQLQGKNINQEDLKKYKYKEFSQWKPRNEWEIQIQGGSIHKLQNIPYQHTILSQRKTRQQILYDLNEILFFYKGVKIQKASIGNLIQTDCELADFSQLDADKAVQKINMMINYLTSQKFSTALQLKNNRKSYQLFVNKFINYKKNIQHMNSQIKIYTEQILQLNKNREKLVQKLRYLRKKAVQAKQECQKLLTDLVSRQIRITGQINKLE